MNRKDNRNATLSDLYQFQYGTGNTIEDIGGDYPIYGSNGAVGFTNIYNSEDAPVIGHIGAYAGIVNWASGRHFVTYNGVICKIKEGVNPKFGYYSLLNSGLQKRLRGSTQPFVSYDLLREVKTYLPDKKTQDNIANTLSKIDAKIEINNKINTELEEMAKTLYDYWFIQFNFPDKKGKPYKTSGGDMIWNDNLKKEIPKGWKVKKISDLIDRDKSGDWGKDEKNGNYTLEVYCIRGADINGLNGKEQCSPPKRYILQKNNHKLLNVNDLIIEISGGSPTQSTGRIAKISTTTKKRFKNPIICSNFCKALTLKDDKLSYNFLYHWSRLYDNDVFFGYEGKTSGIKNFLFESFANSNFLVIPNEDTKEFFFELMEKLEEKRQKNLEEIQKLDKLRDWILPMLMNGQITIK